MPTTTEQRARVHPALPSYSVVVPAPELLSINVAVKDKIEMIAMFRKGEPNLLRHLLDHGTSDGRLGNWGRLWRFDFLNRFCRLPAILSDRPMQDRDHQHGAHDNRTQNARNFFRFHLASPACPLRSAD